MTPNRILAKENTAKPFVVGGLSASAGTQRLESSLSPP